MNDLAIKKDYLPDTLQDLSKFVLFNREKLVAVRAAIRAIDRLGLATETRKQKQSEAQDLAGALLDAEVRIGELLANTVNHAGGRPNKQSLRNDCLPKEIGRNQSSQFQEMARNKDIVEQVKAEAKENDDLATRTEVLRIIKQNTKENRIREENCSRKKSLAPIDLRHGDFKQVLADVNGIDTIITDPPYPKEFIKCFSELSLYAKNHLKDDGFCVCYSGQYHLPEVIQRLSEHLTYIWTFCLYHVGHKQLINGVNVMCGWKPILVFSRGSKKFRFPAYDVVVSEAREKHSHAWQQSESGIENLVEIFSRPGDLIVDPFAGSGTTLAVAHRMGRKTIGAEINDSAKKR